MKLGRYTLLGEIARGGMGIVWLAEAGGPGGFKKRVVVKELRPELAGDAAYRGMFLDEARLAARLTHRNIVQTNEVGEDRGRWFMALELLAGTSLRRAQEARGTRRLPPALAARVAIEILSGLHYAHELTDDRGRPLGVVHRDLSPQNVFVTEEGQIKILDFGVAKSHGHSRDTATGIAKGSVRYMSPEHVDGSSTDRRADVFAAGILLREMLTGAPLWGDLADLPILRALLAGVIPPLHASDVPPDLRRICERAMARRKDDRFATAAEMGQALARWLAEFDPAGSVLEIAGYFQRELACESRRIRELTAAPRTAPRRPPPPLPITLSADDVVTAAPSRPPAVRRPRNVLIACIALGLVGGFGAALGVGSQVRAHEAEAAVAAAPPPAPAATFPISATLQATPADEARATLAADERAAETTPLDDDPSE